MSEDGRMMYVYICEYPFMGLYDMAYTFGCMV